MKQLDDRNYYSISFLYEAATRGVLGGGIHISFSVDEMAETKKLFKAAEFAEEVMETLGIDYRNEYMWPDGSLLYFIRTEYQFIELTIALQAYLKGMRFKLVPVSPLSRSYKDSYDEPDPETVEDYFTRILSNKATAKRKLMSFVYKAFEGR